MFRFTIPAVLSAAALASALPSNKRQETQSVQWGECEFKHENPLNVPFECGTLTVPLDYSDESSDVSFDLNLVKFKASAEPRLGSMLFNPGGPGESAIEAAIGMIQELQVVSGGVYDIIAFDPRGTGRSLPINCRNPQPTDGPVEKREPLLYSEELMAIAERRWPMYEAIAQNCSSSLAETGTFYGTTFVARDMREIVNAIEEDGMLRYYGVSYGTLLGWTFAAMFPDQVDRMILDGNINPVQYWSGYELDSTQDAEALMEGILQACLEDESCPIKGYDDVDSVVAALNAVLEAWKPIPNPSDPTQMLGVADIKFTLLQNMYATHQFPLMATSIATILSGEESEPATPPEVTEPVEAWTVAQEGARLLGIRCSDWPLRATDPSELEGILALIEPKSFSDAMVGDWSACYSWPFLAAEQYTGDFTANTAHPVLFVNPTWDPVTPLAAARNASSGFEGSVVLEHRGHGHGVLTQTSLCTTTYMRNYMVEGTLPDDDTVCEPDMPTYSNKTGIESAIERQEGIWTELIELSGAAKYVEPEAEEGSKEVNSTTGGNAAQANSAASIAGKASTLVVAGLVGVLMMTV